MARGIECPGADETAVKLKLFSEVGVGAVAVEGLAEGEWVSHIAAFVVSGGCKR
jgi:hypothetical protein